VDKVLTSVNHCLITNLLGQNIVGTEMSVNDENAQSPNETQFPLSKLLSQGLWIHMVFTRNPRQQKIKDSYVMVMQSMPPFVQ